MILASKNSSFSGSEAVIIWNCNGAISDSPAKEGNMTKVLAGLFLLVVVLASMQALHWQSSTSRQRSVDAYNAINAYHERTQDSTAAETKYELEMDATVNRLRKNDVGYYRLRNMANAAEHLTLHNNPSNGYTQYDACDLLIRQELNLGPRTEAL
jgi:hypothetical protein